MTRGGPWCLGLLGRASRHFPSPHYCLPAGRYHSGRVTGRRAGITPGEFAQYVVKAITVSLCPENYNRRFAKHARLGHVPIHCSEIASLCIFKSRYRGPAVQDDPPAINRPLSDMSRFARWIPEWSRARLHSSHSQPGCVNSHARRSIQNAGRVRSCLPRNVCV